MVEFTAADIASIEAPTVEMLKLTAESAASFELSYDVQMDVLYVRSEPPPPALSLPVGQCIWLRYDPETLEIVGMEVEAFEKTFLVQNPDLNDGWEQLKPRITRPLLLSDDPHALIATLLATHMERPVTRPLPPRRKRSSLALSHRWLRLPRLQ